jgi:hypothetical protein
VPCHASTSGRHGYVASILEERNVNQSYHPSRSTAGMDMVQHVHLNRRRTAKQIARVRGDAGVHVPHRITSNLLGPNTVILLWQ